MSAAMRVLIVDDSQPMRQMMKLYLRDLADETRECADGAEALAAYAAFRPDWVLMDWEMKAVDGLTAARDIRAAYPEAHILMVTQYDDDELRRAAREAGASGYVLKENLSELHRLLIQEG